MGVRSGSFPLHTVRLRHNVLDRTVSNLFHVGELEPGYVKREGIDLGEQFMDWWRGGTGHLDAPISFCGINATGLDAIANIAGVLAEDPILAIVAAFISVGLAGSECVSNEATVSIEWLTGYGGHAMHGRTFLVAVPDEAFNTANRDELDAGFAHRVLRAYSGLIQFVHDVGPRPGALSLALAHHRPLPRPVGVSVWWTPIVAARIFNSRTAAQKKRRLPYRGPIVTV